MVLHVKFNAPDFIYVHLHMPLLDDKYRYVAHMQNPSLFGARFFNFNLINTGNIRLINFQNGRRLSPKKALQLPRTGVVNDTGRVACVHLQLCKTRITFAFQQITKTIPVIKLNFLYIKVCGQLSRGGSIIRGNNIKIVQSG